MRHSNSLVLALFSTLLLPMGCGETHPPTGRHEYFHYIEEGATSSRRAELGEQLFRFVTERAVPGDVIHCIETPSMSPICSFAIPIATGVARITDPSVGPEIAKLQAYLTANAPGGSHQLGLPSVASSIRRLRRTQLPPRVLLCASPIYDEARHGAWTFANGRAALPRALTAEGSPFAEGCEFLPDGCVVIWLVPPANEDGCIDQPHRKGVFDFNRAFIEHYGGTLHRITENVAAAFDFDGPPAITDQLKAVDDSRSIKMFAIETKPIETPLKVRTFKLGPAKEQPKPLLPAAVAPAPPSTATVIPTQAPVVSALKGDLRNLVVLRDLSGSMHIRLPNGSVDTSPNQAVVIDVDKKLRSLACERLFVLGFGGRGPAGERDRIEVYPWYLLTPGWAEASSSTREAASEAQKQWSIGGGNPMHAALSAANQLDPAPTAVLLYADGDPGGDREELLALVDVLAAKSVTINCIGVGILSGERPELFDVEAGALMHEIARRTNGTYLSLATRK